MEGEYWKISIDWELVRQILIFVSDEVPEGFFELPSENRKYDLTFSQRIELTYLILIKLLNDNLVALEE